MFGSEWEADGLLTAVGVCDLLSSCGWAASELCWQCRVGAAAGVTVLVPLVFHHHFCHDPSVTVRDISPQTGGRRETQCMLFLT